MKEELSVPEISETPENIEKFDDNARKFTVDAISHHFLEEHHAVSYTLIQDWIETSSDKETKIVRKELETGKVEYYLITKVTYITGTRSTDKKKIPEAEYTNYLEKSQKHLEKKRYEFHFDQDDASFIMKYDEFEGGKRPMLEVEAATDGERGQFNPANFPHRLSEVTGEKNYYGYHMADVTVHELQG